MIQSTLQRVARVGHRHQSINNFPIVACFRRNNIQITTKSCYSMASAAACRTTRNVSTDTNSASKTSGNIRPDEILNQCSELYDTITDLNEKLGGVAIPTSSPHTRYVGVDSKEKLCSWPITCNYADLTTQIFSKSFLYNNSCNSQNVFCILLPTSNKLKRSLPFCLLVGNHSSGKSSFINYILQRDIQKAGVAP